jgi:hypothetical protein
MAAARIQDFLSRKQLFSHSAVYCKPRPFLRDFIMSPLRFNTTLCALLGNLCFIASLTAETWVLASDVERTTLIELYTSEGCSSCPPAASWLSNLKQQPDLWQAFILVTFHVDYWDDIGWLDPFAKPEHAQRQRLHQRQGNSRSVYTPGFIVDGKKWQV